MQLSDEQQILSLLREEIVQSGMIAGDLESDLHWEAGTLGDVLSGQESLSLRDLLKILALLEVGATEFFSRAYGFELRDTTVFSIEEATRGRFEESQRVIKEALSRRSAWKKERASF